MLVSIIIPCRNENKTIVKCIDSIINQKCKEFKLEIIVVDGMSDDGTFELLEEISMSNEEVILLKNPYKSIPHALNIGIEQANGSVIIRMDAHAFYPDDYLSRGIGLLMSTNATVVGGICSNYIDDSNLIQSIIAKITNNSFCVGNSPFRTCNKRKFVDSVAYGFFNKKVFDKYGLYDERLIRNQDTEFWYRLRKGGEMILLDPEIKVYYHNKKSWSGLMRQASWTGMWNIFTFFLHPNAIRVRHIVPCLFLAYLITLLATILLASNTIILLALIPIIAYVFMLSIVSYKISKTCRSKVYHVWILFITMCIIMSYHIIYGVGSLVGLLLVLSLRWEKYLGEYRSSSHLRGEQ